MVRLEPMPVEQKAALVEDSRTGTTLDGEPAYVTGYNLPFARVHRRDGKGGEVEFAWPTVQRILSTHRNFQS